jgi:hypothetical protein
VRQSRGRYWVKRTSLFAARMSAFDPKRTSILAQQRRRERGSGQSARRDIFGLYKPNVATLYLGPLRPVSAVGSVNERNLIFGRLAAGVVAAQLNLMYGDKNKCHSGRGWLGNGPCYGIDVCCRRQHFPELRCGVRHVTNSGCCGPGSSPFFSILYRGHGIA